MTIYSCVCSWNVDLSVLLYIQEAVDSIKILSDKCVRVTGWSTQLVQASA